MWKEIGIGIHYDQITRLCRIGKENYPGTTFHCDLFDQRFRGRSQRVVARGVFHVRDPISGLRTAVIHLPLPHRADPVM